MDERKARELVVQAGLELVKDGLIARTWGNVSCRLDSESFVITPSGRAYERLTTEDIVVCKIADGSYGGNIKPSSERGVHALIYRERPDANFVIHTHQTQASAVSVMNKPGIPEGSSSSKEFVPTAAYGLPGTNKLVKGISEALMKTRGKAVIMSHHGTVCFGADDRDAFSAAQTLENDCRRYIRKVYSEAGGKVSEDENDIYLNYLNHSKLPQKPLKLGSSRRTPDGFILNADGREITYAAQEQGLPLEVAIHAEIYLKRKDVNYITYADGAPLVAAASAGTPLVAILDDFAQIEGRRALCAKSASPADVVSALGRRAGVLVPGSGALCCGNTEPEAHAVLLVMEKNAYAQISANLTGKPKLLSVFDCCLMRTVYKLSYSKKE
ncbi:MAG: class II aldolase/adducin family protein [Oscillospiraceae bacterium]